MEKKLCSLLLFFSLAALSAVAQTEDYLYKATIDSIKEAGFYNIVISPAINAHLKTDYSDLRIINSAGKWVPHLLRQPNSERSAAKLVLDLPVVKNESNASFTELVIKSAEPNISNLVLKIKNTEAERFATLTGSDDAATWYIINDSIAIKPLKSGDGNTATFNIAFPANNYAYYKLYINNKEKAPFNIMSVGTTSIATDGKNPLSFSVIENPAPAIMQKDSGKVSFIKIIQPASYHIEKISLKISGVKYFYRRADLYVPSPALNSINSPGRLLQSFTISNNSTLEFNIPLSNADSFYLIINNEDNLPLKLEEIKTYSHYRVATVYFEKGKHYKMIMANKNAIAANYDLQQLNLNLKEVLPLATIGNIELIKNSALSSAKNNKWMIWLTIILAALTLGYFTYKLITDISKKETA